MTDIKLPTYKSIIRNEVFGKKAKPLEGQKHEDIPATRLVRLTQFKVPTLDEIIGHIQVCSAQIEKLSLFEEMEDSTPGVPTVTDFLRQYHSMEIKKIIQGDDEIIQHLKKHYPKTVLHEGRNYLESLNGIVTDESVRDAKKSSVKMRSMTYKMAIEARQGNNWRLAITLSEDYMLPDSLEMKYLIDKEVTNCNIFSVRGSYENYNEVASYIKQLYAALKSPNLFKKVVNISSQCLERSATDLMNAAAECRAAQGIGNILSSIFDQTMLKQADKSPEFPHLSDFSDPSKSRLN